jgi:hypothetical protein
MRTVEKDSLYSNASTHIEIYIFICVCGITGIYVAGTKDTKLDGYK